MIRQTLMDDPDSLIWELLYDVYDEHDQLSHRFRTLREEQSTSDGYRLQSPRTRMRDRPRVAEAVEEILTARSLSDILIVEILEEEEVKLKQATAGRRTKETQCTREVRLRFDLTWKVDADALARVRRADGVFPLVTNDRSLTAQEVLRAYKRQPIIEKRFSQLKSDFCVAPLQSQLIKLFGITDANYGRKK